MTRSLLATLLVLALPATAAAETEISIYSGFQTARDGDVEGNDPGGLGAFDFGAGWDGNSLEAPPYFGIRGTWWRDERNGIALDFNHTKIYADDETLDENGIEELEFSDGLNLITVNYMRRFPGGAGSRLTPYVGAGLGLAVPHVEVETAGGDTSEYQITGPAATVIAGASYEINDTWSVFGEYKGSYSSNDADLDNGGTLESDIVTNALNLGVSFSF